MKLAAKILLLALLLLLPADYWRDILQHYLIGLLFAALGIGHGAGPPRRH